MVYILTTKYMLRQGHDTAPGLDIMLLKQQFLSVSGQAQKWAEWIANNYAEELNVLRSMESKGIHRVYEYSPVPTLYVWRVEDLLGRVPLIPCFLDGNAPSTIPHKYSSRQKGAFGCGCADGAGPTSRRGNHVYEINTWLWNFGRPQPRVGGLSVAKTEKLRRKSRSEASKRGLPDGQLSGLASDLRMVYA
jgi:hypothetical protein